MSDPIPPTLSFKDSLTGKARDWSLLDDEEFLDSLDTNFASLEFSDDVYDSSIPSLPISSSLRRRLAEPYKRSLIGKLFEKRVGFSFLQEKVNQLWQLSGSVQILDLGFDYFLFRF